MFLRETNTLYLNVAVNICGDRKFGCTADGAASISPDKNVLVQGDEEGHGTPCLRQFTTMCSTLMSARTVLLLAFEPRASEVREALLRELSQQFGVVESIPSSAWEGVLGGCDHIELYRVSSRPH